MPWKLDIFLDILEGYGIGPQARRIRYAYWDRLPMVALVGGYYGAKLQGFGGVNHG